MSPLEFIKAFGFELAIFIFAACVVYGLLKEQINKLKLANNKLEEANSRFDTELTEIRSELKKRQTETNMAGKQVNSDRNEVKLLVNNVSTLTSGLAKQKTLISTLNSQLKDYSNESENIKKEIDVSIDRMNNLSGSIADFSQHIKNNAPIDPLMINTFEAKLNSQNLELRLIKKLLERFQPQDKLLDSYQDSIYLAFEDQLKEYQASISSYFDAGSDLVNEQEEGSTMIEGEAQEDGLGSADSEEAKKDTEN